MEKDTRSDRYSLRGRILPSKRLRDYKLDGKTTGRGHKLPPDNSERCSPALRGSRQDHTYSCASKAPKTGAERPAELSRFLKNAAELPELCLEPVSASASTPETVPMSQPLLQEHPLLMLGHTVTEYKNIYHSVLDPLVTTSSGRPRSYNLTLGRKIKQRLWDALNCPTLVSNLQPEGTYSITVNFSEPSVNKRVPNVDIDTTGEPMPVQPKKRRRIRK